MSRGLIILAVVTVCVLVTTSQVFSQASKEIDGRAKGVATSQEKSWQQVDEINKETDRTKGRYQQAQQSGAQPQKSGYSVKRSSVGSRSAYRKLSPPKKKTASKRK